MYNIPAIQNYFEYIIKKHETIAETVPVLIYANNITNRIVFKIKTGNKLELLSKETMKLGSTKDTIDTDKDSENVPRLENVEVILVHCNLVNNSYQQHSRVLFTFVPNKQYGQLINISPHSLIFLKTINIDFSEIEVWFTDQSNNASEIGDNQAMIVLLYYQIKLVMLYLLSMIQNYTFQLLLCQKKIIKILLINKIKVLKDL